jgi:prevent-host-death family protein
MHADLSSAAMALEYHFMRTELVTTLKRKATEIIADLEQDHEPVLITQHGRPAAYLIDVDSFEALNQRIAVLEGIARAEQAIDQGRVISHEEAKNKMGRWLN